MLYQYEFPKKETKATDDFLNKNVWNFSRIDYPGFSGE